MKMLRSTVQTASTTGAILLMVMMVMFGTKTFAQEVNVDNAVINVPAGVFMTTDGGVVIQNAGAMDNGGTVAIKGNWTNNGNGLINNSAGTVVLAGANETIGGANPTTFSTLSLQGTGVKTLAVNATVTSTLALNDRELFTGVNTVFVTNPSTGAVTWSTGFISSAPGGSLSRVMAAVSTYVFPVGAVGRFRPVEITPSTATSQTYSVRMANVDANTEGFPRSTNDGTMTSINGTYYHQINRVVGTTPSDVAIYYDPGQDGTFSTLTHWQGNPRWENMTPVASVSNYGLSGLKKSGWNNYSPFALANSDVTPPVITCPGNVTVQCNTSTLPTATGSATATDNLDPNPVITFTDVNALGGCNGTGTITRTWRATDAAGNFSTCVQVITVIDNTAPVITSCPGNISVNNTPGLCSAPATYAGTATDNCGTPTVSFSPASGSTFPVGATTVTMTAADACGNTTTCSFSVTVNDVTPPTISCPGNISVIATGASGAVVNYVAPVGTDNCGGATTAQTTGLPSGSTFPIGVTTNTFVVTAANGQTSTCSFTVTVSGVAPAIVCPSNITVNNAPGLCNNTVTFAATDPVGIPASTITYSQAPGSVFPVGTTTVTATATNVVGSSSCTFTVTVVDNQAPNALCQNLTVTLNASGAGSITPAQVNNGSNDNCGVSSVSLSVTAFGCANQGNNTTVLTVTDVNGNTATCTSSIYVQDITPPTALCQNITVQLNNLGTASITASQINNGSFDNCSVASLTLNTTTFSCANVGANTVTLTVTDNSTTGGSIVNSNLIGHWTFEPGVETVDLTGNWSNLQTFGGATIAGGSLDVTGATQFAKAPSYSGPAITNKTLISWVSLDDINVMTGSALTIDRISIDMFDGIIYGEQQPFRWMNGSSNFDRTQAAVPGFAETTPNQPIMMAITYQDLGAGNVEIRLYRNGVLIGNYIDSPIASWSAGDAEVWFGKRHGTGTTGPGQLDAKIQEARIYGRVLSATELQALAAIYNSSTCTATVTVEDLLPPTALCQPVTVQLNSGGTGSITASQVNNGSSDNCGIASLAVSPNTFNCTNVTPAPSIWINEIHYDNSSTDVNEFVELAGTAGINLANYALVRYNGATPSAAVIYSTPAQTTTLTGTIPNQSNGYGTFAVFYAVDGLQNGPNDGIALVNTSNNTVVQLLSYEGAFTVASGQGLASGMTATNLPVAEAGTLAGGSIRLTGNGNAYGSFAWQPEAAPASPGAINAGQTFASVVNTTVLTVTDVNGNTATCSSNVTVQDLVAPVATCQNLTVNLSATGSASLNATQVNNGSSDACGIGSLSINVTAFGCANVGNNTVILTVTDVNGNSSTCSSTVLVRDVTPPTAVCQNLTVNLSATGTASITASQVNNGSSDACGIGSLSINVSAFTCANLGANTVILTVTDVNTNTSTCSSTVTVRDVTAPAITCPSNVTVQCNTSTLPTATGSATATDACTASPVITFTDVNSLGGCNGTGTITRTWRATDGSGNSSTCVQVITVIDNTAPVVSVPAQGLTVQCDGAGNTAQLAAWLAAHGGAVATDNCGAVTWSFTFGGLSDLCGATGVGTATFIASDACGNTSTSAATFTIIDNVPPVLTTPANVTVQCNTSTLPTATGTATATDVCSATVPSFWINEFHYDNSGTDVNEFIEVSGAAGINLTGTALILYNGADGMSYGTIPLTGILPNAGNGYGSLSFPAVGLQNGNPDGIALVNTTPAGVIEFISYGGSFVALNGIAAGTTSTSVGVTESGSANGTSISRVGSGNTRGQFTWALTTTQTPGAANVGQTFVAPSSGVTIASSDVATLTGCNNTGTIVRTWTATDACGNSSTGVQTINVIDNTAPTAICQNVTVDLDNAGNGSTTAAAVNNGSSDNCGAVTLALSQTAFSCANVGANAVTLTVSDACGNTSTCGATVTVRDLIPPVAVCQAVTVQLDNTGNGTITASQVNNGSSDACGIASLSLSVSAYTCANVGSGNTTVLTVTDVNGNSSTCSATVTVVDAVPPVALCQNVTVQLDNTGNGSITASQVDNGSTDACGIASLSVNPNTFNCSNVNSAPVVDLFISEYVEGSGSNKFVEIYNPTGAAVNLGNYRLRLYANGATTPNNDVLLSGSIAAGGTVVYKNSSAALVVPGAINNAAVNFNGNDALALFKVSTNANVDIFGRIGEDPGAAWTGGGNSTVDKTLRRNASVTSGVTTNPGAGFPTLATQWTQFNIDVVSGLGAHSVAPTSNTVTLTVTDVNGNSSTCTATVTVVDNVPPVAVCQPLTVQLNASGNASITAAQLNNGSSDACGILGLAAAPTTFTCANVGANTVTLTVTDVNGNTATCTSTVTVQDLVPPTALCQNLTINLNSGGTASITASQINNASTDNCGISNLGIDVSNFSCSDVGGDAGLDLFISEYVEGSGNNKFLELYNPTAGSINLGNYRLRFYANGATSPNNDVLLSGTLAAGATVVYKNTSASLAVPGAITNSAMNFNGNDAMVLYKVSTNANVDIFGRIGEDPGTAWTGGGNTTVDKTLRRNAGVNAGVAVNPTAGFPTLGNQWVMSNIDDISGLGAHSFTGRFNNVVLTVTDVNGNTNACTAGVTVNDVTPPTAVCQSLTINIGSTGSSTVAASSVDNGSSDACGIASISLNPNTFTCDDLGVNNVTLTVTDVNGNSSTCGATVTVTNDPLLATTASPTVACGYNVTCNGATNGSATVTTVGGCLPYTYLWSNGQTSSTATGLGAGTYTVTVTDVNGTTTTSTITLTEPALLTSAATSPTVQGGYNITCFGANDGSIDLTVAGGASCLAYTFVWNTGATTEDLSGLVAGTYSVTVTDANGCVTTTSITLTEPPMLVTTLIAQVYQGGWNITCNGASDGMLYADVNGGTPAYSFAWSNGATTQLVTGLTAGTYTVTVTDANGCFNIETMTLTEPPLMVDAISAVVRNCGYNVSCNGATDGSIDYTVSGGTAPYIYNWSNGATTEDISGLAAGTYSVTATDRNGCTTSSTITLTEPAVLTANIVLGTYNCGYNVSCNGAADGNAVVNVTGGCGPYTYAWSPMGQVVSTINGLPAMAISVTVTDANGCQAFDADELIEPAPLVSTGVAATYVCGYNVSCNGASDGSIDLSVTGGASCLAYTYSWSTGATTEDVSGLSAGTYSVTVYDANGCSTVSTFTLNEPDQLRVTSITAATYQCGYNISCNGASDGSINLTPGGGATCVAYTYAWSNGATTEDLSGLTAGTYSVTVTDANGCSTTASITLTQPAVLASSGVAATYNCGTNVSCNGALDGSINLSVTGGASCHAYTYLWSNGATTEDVSGLGAGSYSVTVTDANGCSTTSSFTLTQPALLVSSGVPATYACGYNVTCNGASNGSINLSATGGASCLAYTYNWSNGATTEDVSGLSAGTYTVTVTDANGCSTTSTFTLTEPAVLAKTNFSSPTHACGYNISCNGGSDGVINLDVTGGASCLAYTYLWSDGATTEDRSGLAAGTYSVTVTDANGCSFSDAITLTQPALLTLAITSPTHGGYNISCNGGNDGVVAMTVSGGASCLGYTYLWSNGATTEDLTGLTAGTYSVTVTDANGCVAVGSITLTEPTPVVANAGPDVCVQYGYQTISCTTLVGTQTGGVAPYIVRWNEGSANGPLVATTSSVQVCPAVTTTYCYTVTDANGCTHTDCMVVNVTDIRCGNNLQKITICHIPPGNGGNPQTLCVAVNAVAQHVPGHGGDYLGACGATSPCTNLKSGEPASSAAAATDAGEAELTAFPNPFSSVTTVRFSLPDDGAAELHVYSMTGEKVAVLFDGMAEAGRQYEVEWKPSGVSQGIYFAKLITSDGAVRNMKLVLNR